MTAAATAAEANRTSASQRGKPINERTENAVHVQFE
jgi:hypothetical protein